MGPAFKSPFETRRAAACFLTSAFLTAACAGSATPPPRAEPERASAAAPRPREAPCALAILPRKAPVEGPGHRRDDEDQEPERTLGAYRPFFDAVRERFAARNATGVEGCCRSASEDPHAAEYCSAALSLLRRELKETDDAAFLASLPVTRARIAASNELDLILSDYEPDGPEPFGLYFARAWRLAHEGNVQAAEAFVVMYEHSHGVFAEAAEGSLCSVFRDRPELYAALEARHRRAIRELRVDCPRMVTP